LRSKIEELEILRLKYYSIVEKKMLDDLRAGRPVDPKFLDFSGMKERYLEALEAYGSRGLTPHELYKARLSWLLRPLEKMGDVRVKTISTFLQRLCLDGLARREREGHTYRYFITDSGKKRLNYYRDRRERKKSEIDEQKSWDESLFAMILSNMRTIEDIKDTDLRIEKLGPSFNPSFSKTYSLLSEWIQYLLDCILFLQISIFIGDKRLTELAINESSKCLDELQKTKNTIFAVLVAHSLSTTS